MNKKKLKKKVTLSFCTTSEVAEALDAIGEVLGEETGKELSRSNVIEIALLRFFKQYNNYIEAKLKQQNKENKEDK